MYEPLRFIAPMPRLQTDGATWVSAVRRLEALGFDTVAVSHHVTKQWQLSPLVAMAFAAASTKRLRVLSLVMQNDLQHPAMLAKDVATIDALSDGRVELGIGIGWRADDYTAIGCPFDTSRTRIARLAEALEICRQYFTREAVDFVGEHFRVNHMEALPRCVQRPNPPILVGAGGRRMLDLAGRTSDIVGLHPRMRDNGFDRAAAVADLTPDAIEAKVDRVRKAAAQAGRPSPAFQFSCYYVHVTDAPGAAGPRSSWAAYVEAERDSLQGSPAVLVGTAAECADRLLDWRERFGITYWNLGADVDAVSGIVEKLGRA